MTNDRNKIDISVNIAGLWSVYIYLEIKGKRWTQEICCQRCEILSDCKQQIINESPTQSRAGDICWHGGCDANT